jgi:hypothetical protein
MQKAKILLINVLILAISTSSFSQTICDCKAFINPHYGGQIYLFDKPNGLKTDSIRNDVEHEDYLAINILKDDDDYFYVKIARSIAKLSKEGWIKKNDYLVIGAGNFINSKTLILYSKPDINSDPKSILNEYIYILFRIEACQGDWLYVKKDYNGIEYIGWLSKKYQCANPYSTCN